MTGLPPPARLRSEGYLSGENLVDILLHVLLHPWLEVRIRKIGDPERRLLISAIGNEGMGRVGGHGSGVMAGSWIEERASGIETGPSDVIRRKVRWSG
jgi:hypothetical protein